MPPEGVPAGRHARTMERWVGVCRGRSGLGDCLAREGEDGSNVLLLASSVSLAAASAAGGRGRQARRSSRPGPGGLADPISAIQLA